MESSDWIVGQVEWMIFGWYFRIETAFRDEGVRATTNDMYFGNEQTIDVPRDSPTNVTYG